MTAATASLIGRRERLWPAIALSAAVHVGLAAWALAHRAPSDLGTAQRPIVAKLVRLGEKRPERLLPRKEEAAPPVAGPKGPVAPVAPPATRAKPAVTPPKEKAAPEPKAKPPERVAQVGGGDPLARVLSTMERQKAAEAPRWGDPRGDAEGDASEAGEGDRYLALAVRALQANYRVPATLSDKERLHLKATVILFVEPSGTIREFRFESRSGSDAFDAALERAIRATRLPPPPPALRDSWRRDGLGVNFHI